jgi:hypothetical protein
MLGFYQQLSMELKPKAPAKEGEKYSNSFSGRSRKRSASP